MSPAAKQRVEKMLKDLCLFDEHTWGANNSVSQPDSLDTYAQYAEKSLLAYRPMGHAEWLLGQRARTHCAGLPEGLYITNTARQPFSGWASFQGSALRAGSRSLQDPKTGASIAIEKQKGGDLARFWVEKLPPTTTFALNLSTAEAAPVAAAPGPEVRTDDLGWPRFALWNGMKSPLFDAELGDFVAVNVALPADRSIVNKIQSTKDQDKRAEIRAAGLRQTRASAGAAKAQETPHTLVYTQPFEHASLSSASRTLELWKREPRARLTVRLDRLSSLAPEAFYIGFSLPVQNVMPVFSNGGIPFVPYRDQLEGTCRDYYAIDGWARYDTPEGQWLWVTRDAPLVTVGGPHTLVRRQDAPPDTHRVMAMVFDNFWHTNFVANSHGELEFQFELVWREKLPDAAELAATLVSEPVLVLNPAAKASPELQNDIFRP